MLSTQVPGLYLLQKGRKGRGVYTTNPLVAGSIIELCPVILIPSRDTATIHATVLHDYYFIWDRRRGESCIALGYGSIYNHAAEPNAEFTNDYDSQMIRITAIRDIAAHEEITLAYLPEEEKEYQLWFSPE